MISSRLPVCWLGVPSLSLFTSFLTTALFYLGGGATRDAITFFSLLALSPFALMVLLSRLHRSTHEVKLTIDGRPCSRYWSFSHPLGHVSAPNSPLLADIDVVWY